MEDILNLIGLMAKSGNIVSGEENLIKNIKNKNINYKMLIDKYYNLNEIKKRN